MTHLVIFDCDGVLVDSDRISLRVQAEQLRALGLAVSYEDCVREFLGLGMPATLRIVEQRLGHAVPQRWVDDLDVAVRRAFESELVAVPGIADALDAISAPTCIASSGSHEKMRFTLSLTGLYERFAGRILRRRSRQRCACSPTPPLPHLTGSRPPTTSSRLWLYSPACWPDHASTVRQLTTGAGPCVPSPPAPR